MLRRDYLVKQLEEFGKAMALLLGLKRDGRMPEFEEELKRLTTKYTGLEISYVEGMPENDLLRILTEDKKLNDEQLKMLADLLYEKAGTYMDESNETSAMSCYRRVLQLYTFLQANATIPYSLEVHYRVKLLQQMLG